MFSLIYGFIEYCTRKEEYHILILGLDKAGKTNLLEKLKTLFTDLPGLEPGKIMPTVGLNVGRIEAFKSQLILWDLGGQPGLRGIWDKYFAEAHAVVYVVDATGRERFAESRAALERIMAARELVDAPLLVVANKQDVTGAAGMEEVVDAFSLANVDARPCIVQPASAHTGQGVSDGMKWLVDTIRQGPRAAQIAARTARYGAG